MNSHQRRKTKRAVLQAKKRLEQISKDLDLKQAWDKIVEGIGPAGRTDK